MEFIIDRIKFNYNICRQGIECFIGGYTREMNPRRAYALPVELKIDDEPGEYKEPAFMLSDTQVGCVQELFDDLWRMGYRPGKGLRAEPDAAMQAHLDDMRKLVFDVTVPLVTERKFST